MRTNADCTLYTRSIDPATHGEKYTRTQIRSVAWNNTKVANVTKSGLLEADAVSVYIPMARGALAIKAGDVLVKGLVTDELSSSFTLTALKAKYADVVIVTKVDTMAQGSIALWHWQIGAS
jgi:hypothetical protein